MQVLHKHFLESDVRTVDPEHAQLFFIPVYLGHYFNWFWQQWSTPGHPWEIVRDCEPRSAAGSAECWMEKWRWAKGVRPARQALTCSCRKRDSLVLRAPGSSQLPSSSLAFLARASQNGLYRKIFEALCEGHDSQGDFLHKNTSALVAEALEHVRSSYPHWDRRNGADHFMVFSFDHARCDLAPALSLDALGRMFSVQSFGDLTAL